MFLNRNYKLDNELCTTSLASFCELGELRGPVWVARRIFYVIHFEICDAPRDGLHSVTSVIKCPRIS